ncbi:hypothetical protein [Streptomyces sp. SAI-208]|uniref:hypothetical protein n=1 Tax=Streptomyces sp. SAI-208 TaxID=2940550 RepID=UPI002475C8D6|nr:hypothetical protein [Streptomyces sp. SAI-208]
MVIVSVTLPVFRSFAVTTPVPEPGVHSLVPQTEAAVTERVTMGWRSEYTPRSPMYCLAGEEPLTIA